MKRNIILFIEISAVIATIIWWISDQSIIPFIGILTSLSAFLGTLFLTKNKAPKKAGDNFSQKAGKNSKQYMSKGDMNIGKD